MTTTPDLAALLRIAEQATPGKWTWGSRWVCQRTGDDKYVYLAAVPPDEEDGDRWCKDAAHIAAFNPRTAQALVKVAMAAEVAQQALFYYKDTPSYRDDMAAPGMLKEALAELTAALKEQGAHHGE